MVLKVDAGDSRDELLMADPAIPIFLVFCLLLLLEFSSPCMHFERSIQTVYLLGLFGNFGFNFRYKFKLHLDVNGSSHATTFMDEFNCIGE
jgi:hypothetical protein